jgi:hypothetical protein
MSGTNDRMKRYSRYNMDFIQPCISSGPISSYWNGAAPGIK